MILVTLWGGLGNQMFQYAAGLALATRRQTDLKLDISHLTERGQKRALDSGGTPRGFELGDFNIGARVASDREVRKYIPTQDSTIVDKVVTRARRMTGQVRHYQAPKFGYDAKFERLTGTVSLTGRFHHPEYFSCISDKLHEQFRPKLIGSAAAEAINSLEGSNSIGIHVRRGDLVSNPTYSFIGSQTSEYFKAAYEKTRSVSTGIDEIYVFSDDVEWCRDNLNFLENAIFVSEEHLNINAHEEFEVMKYCKHLIISNSTYSWWAAWLKEDKSGTVVAPRTWVREPAVFADEVCPPEWIQV